MNRKDFIKNTAFAGLSLSLFPTTNIFAGMGDGPKVRLAIIGCGARGIGHVDLVLRRNDTELVAICEVEPRALQRTKDLIKKSGKKNAAGLYRRCKCVANFIAKGKIRWSDHRYAVGMA
jgi:predicted homoserine dehydrogenase-like protein